MFDRSFWSEQDRLYRYRINKLVVENEKVSSESLQRFVDQLYLNLVGRTGLIFRVLEFLLPDGVTQREPNADITIACISSQIKVAGGGTRGGRMDLHPRALRDNCTLLSPADNMNHQAWEERRLRELNQALEYKPDVICFGELAYPPPEADSARDHTVNVLDSYGRKRDAFEQKVCAKLKEYESEAFVFLGSYHCLLSLYNVGVIYPLGYHDERIDVKITERSLIGEEHGPRTDRVSPPTNYLKRFPARRAGEFSRVPSCSEFQIYRTKVGRIAVLICSDVLDLNQFLLIARQNFGSDNPIEMVLVPSYNKSEILRSMCREISYLANTVVVNVNANDDDDGFPDTEVFVCGLAGSEIGENFVVSKSVSFSVQHDPERVSALHLFTFPDGNLRALRDAVLRQHFQGRGRRGWGGVSTAPF